MNIEEIGNKLRAGGMIENNELEEMVASWLKIACDTRTISEVCLTLPAIDYAFFYSVAATLGASKNKMMPLFQRTLQSVTPATTAAEVLL